MYDHGKCNRERHYEGRGITANLPTKLDSENKLLIWTKKKNPLKRSLRNKKNIISITLLIDSILGEIK